MFKVVVFLFDENFSCLSLKVLAFLGSTLIIGLKMKAKLVSNYQFEAQARHQSINSK